MSAKEHEKEYENGTWKDIAGNYHFKVDDREYMIQRMNWMEQREVMKLIHPVVYDDETRTYMYDPSSMFSEDTSEIEDKLLPLVRYVGDGEPYLILDKDGLTEHIDSIDGGYIDVISIFGGTIGTILSNFFQSGEKAPAKSKVGTSNERSKSQKKRNRIPR